MTHFDAIVFDIGGTLLRTMRDPQEMALERIAHLGTVPLSAFRSGVDQAIREWKLANGQPHEEDLSSTWVRHYMRALTLAGFAGDCAVAAHIMEDGFLTDGLEVFPDAVPLLESLHARGVVMGIVSNWPGTLEATLERAGLRHYFSVVVPSAAVGYAKPHPQIFRIAAERLGVDCARTLYVGDSVEHDVVGGTSVGMTVALIDRDGRHAQHELRITSLAAVLTVFDRRQSTGA